MMKFKEQAARFGAEFITEKVTRVDFSQRPFTVWVRDQEHKANSVIVATGGVPDLAPIEGGDLCQTTWDVLSDEVPAKGDVLIWDHIGTWHNAIADYTAQEHRHMKRCQVMATRYFRNGEP